MLSLRKKYRMSRRLLDEVTKRIQDNDVFTEQNKGPNQREVKHQLMVLLQFLGKEGECNASQRNTFKISAGSCQKYRERAVEALVSIRDDYIKWPDEKERKEIAKRIENEFTLPNCVSLMDGTLANLAITPRSSDKSDYKGRKYGYTLTIMVINDDKRVIRAYLSGFPGSSHDNRVWSNMDHCQNPHKYFLKHEYILCDTAFVPSDHAIPAYKCEPGFLQDPDEQRFNTALASPRVISEHCMGIWKGRFPWLRNIRMIITDDPKSLKKS